MESSFPTANVKIAVFDTHRYDRDALEEANRSFGYSIVFLEPRLTIESVSLAMGYDVICSFVNDRIDRAVLQALRGTPTKLIALRSAGFNHVDIAAADECGIKVVRVPEYSPHAVAEHAVALMLTLNRKIHRAYARVREGNFSLHGLTGFDFHGKTVGIVGTGRIGCVAARIMSGFGCQILAFDLYPRSDLAQQYNFTYVDFPTLCKTADIISLHVPLTPTTRHLICEETIAQMKRGVMIINTGRGALIDSEALVEALKAEKVGSAGLDVYEEEEGVFFRDLSDEVLQDDLLARLLTFPNVVITSHQGFLTKEALANIAQTTLSNIRAFVNGEPLLNEVKPEPAN